MNLQKPRFFSKILRNFEKKEKKEKKRKRERKIWRKLN